MRLNPEEFESESRRIIGEIREGRLDRHREDGLSIADIERDFRQFEVESEILRDVGASRPCLRTESYGLVPVALSTYLPGLIWFDNDLWPDPLRHRPYHRYYSYIFEELYLALRERLGDEYEFVDEERAGEFLYSNAVRFLSERLAAVRTFFGPERGSSSTEGGGGGGFHRLRLPFSKGSPPHPTLGCSFSVTTDTPNLKAHWSGAYYIRDNNFGYPTSPVNGPLQAGSYVFGVSGGAYGNRPTWDKGTICTIPGSTSTHLFY